MSVRTRSHALTIDSSLKEYDEEFVETEPKTLRAKAKELARKRLPFLQWVPKYKKNFLLSDLIAGITVWLTAVPQSMAYARVAGLTPEYGLYSHFVGPFVYILLGSMRQVTIGPTAVVELTTHQTCGDDNLDCVILMGFYSGVVELVLGILNLGVIVSFISEPVTVGFTCGSAFTIASSQVKSLLGLAGKPKGNKFISIWEHIFENIGSTKLGDAVLGLSIILLLLILQKFKDIKPPTGFKHPNIFKSVQRWVVLARNAVAIILSAIIAYAWSGSPPFSLNGKVQSGLPPVRVPSFTLYDPASNSTEPMSFTETLGFMKTGPIAVAIIAILQNVAITKIYGSGQTIDGTQEMIALGTTNILGGFFSSLPTSGSFSRSAINDASGVKSQFGGFYVGVLILLTLSFLTPTFQYIPKASLAAVIVCAVIFMIEFDVILLIWRTSKIDFLCFSVTFISSLLLGMEYGIAAGVGVSILVVLLKSLRPSMPFHLLTDRATKVKYLLLTPDQGFYFPSVDFIRDRVNEVSRRFLNYPVIVVQCDKWTRWDYTSVTMLIGLAKSLEKHGKTLILYRAAPVWSEAIESFGVKKPICCSSTLELHGAFQELKPKNKALLYGTSNNESTNSTTSNASSEQQPSTSLDVGLHSSSNGNNPIQYNSSD